jgi:hypothetical protein
VEERATIVLLPQGRSIECPLMADAVESYFHNVEFINTCACAEGTRVRGGCGGVRLEFERLSELGEGPVRL